MAKCEYAICDCNGLVICDDGEHFSDLVFQSLDKAKEELRAMRESMPWMMSLHIETVPVEGAE